MLTDQQEKVIKGLTMEAFRGYNTLLDCPDYDLSLTPHMAKLELQRAGLVVLHWGSDATRDWVELTHRGNQIAKKLREMDSDTRMRKYRGRK